MKAAGWTLRLACGLSLPVSSMTDFNIASANFARHTVPGPNSRASAFER